MRHEYDPRIEHSRIIWHEDPNFEAFMLDLITKTKPDRIVETGTHMGWTAAWFAENFPSIHVHTVEVDPGYAKLSRENLEPYPNAHCYDGSSPAFLRSLAPIEGLTLFWLDAHWWPPVPLKEECSIVAKLDRYIAVLDDYYCADPDFEGDTFENGRNNVDYVADSLGRRVARPNYPSKPGYKGYGLYLKGVEYELPATMKWDAF